MKKVNLFLLALLVATLFSCKPDKLVNPNAYNLGSGVFVLNEGNFQFSNASLSFYDPQADTVANDLFYKVNSAPLGDVAQSLALADGKLYIVVNNSNYIYKVDANTMVCDTTKPFKLGDFYSPREMHVVAPNKAYVSDLIGTGLWIVNPQDMSHSGSIEMGKSTEKMVQVGNELYVSNWSNYYVPGMEKNSVQVVDINNDVKVAEIQVGKEPNCMAVDKNNHVWVLCEGATWEADGENPTLWEIDPMLKSATLRYEFDGTAMILKANASGDGLYLFIDNEVRRFDIAASTLSETFRIAAPEGGMFYNMAVNPQNGELYVTDAKNYLMDGTVYRYSEDGVLLSSFEAGVIPSAMLFK
jgi:DNA-binding beta-propeller fold protein YncE